MTLLALAFALRADAALPEIPPSQSYEWGLQVSYGSIPHFYPEAWAWPGLGLRASGGWHLGQHRLGGAIGAAVEGEVPVYYNLVASPQLTWDTQVGTTQFGASLGADLLTQGAMGLQDNEWAFTTAPAVALRIGYSEPWSVISRRMFVILEPRVRFIGDKYYPTASIQIGSGRAR